MDGSFDRLGNGDADEDDEDAVGPDDEEPSWQSGSSAYRASVDSKENEWQASERARVSELVTQDEQPGRSQPESAQEGGGGLGRPEKRAWTNERVLNGVDGVRNSLLDSLGSLLDGSEQALIILGRRGTRGSRGEGAGGRG